VTECQDHRGRRATIELVAQLAPMHEQLTSFFQVSDFDLYCNEITPLQL
jgi:hypothetical protein